MNRELIDQAIEALALGHRMLLKSHDRKLVDRLTVLQGYFQFLHSFPKGDLDCEAKLRAALDDVKGIIEQHSHHEKSA